MKTNCLCPGLFPRVCPGEEGGHLELNRVICWISCDPDVHHWSIILLNTAHQHMMWLTSMQNTGYTNSLLNIGHCKRICFLRVGDSETMLYPVNCTDKYSNDTFVTES